MKKLIQYLSIIKKELTSTAYWIILHALAFSFAWGPLLPDYKTGIALLLFVGAILIWFKAEAKVFELYRTGKLVEVVIYSDQKREEIIQKNQQTELQIQKEKRNRRMTEEEIQEYEDRIMKEKNYKYKELGIIS